MNRKLSLKSLFLFLILGVLVACGGSSSSSDGDGDGDNSNDTYSDGNDNEDNSSDDNDNGGNTSSNFDRAAMVENYANNIIIPNYQAVVDGANTWDDSSSIGGYCSAIGTATESAALETVLNDWKGLMLLVTHIDHHPIGPVTENNNTLLDRINHYNNHFLNPCLIDQSAYFHVYGGGSSAPAAPFGRGVGALEYLLFNTDLTFPQCSSPAKDPFNALSGELKKSIRCDYAEVILQDLITQAQTIVDLWTTTGGGYKDTEFTQSVYEDAVLKALSDSLFYLEDITKDRKIAASVGIHSDCTAEDISCPEFVESPYTETSFTNVLNNLIAFKEFFNGGTASSGLGFDDLLEGEAGQNGIDIANNINSSTDSAIAFVNTILDSSSNLGATYHDSLLDQANSLLSGSETGSCVNSYSNYETIREYTACSLYGYLKEITDELRGPYLIAVGLDLPSSVQSDND